MIDRKKLDRCVDAMDALDGVLETNLELHGDGRFSLWARPLNYGDSLSEDDRHKVLAVLTPLVGKLEKKNEDTSIHYEGEFDGLHIYLRRADTCQIVGYKKRVKRVARLEVKTIQKEEEVETGEYDEEEELIPITDCEIRQGRASPQDIEVPA